MITALVWTIAALLYGAVWLPTALVVARALMKPRCHGENRQGYEWYDRCGDCDTDCWRVDERPSLEQCVYGAMWAVLWPLVLPAFLVYALGGRQPRMRLLTAAQLAALEREAGIQ